MSAGAHPPLRLTGQLVFGLLIIVAGVLFTLDNLGITDASNYFRYWPVALIAVGVTKLVEAQRRHVSPVGGSLFAIIGTALLARNLEYARFDLDDFWPLLLIFVGGMIVWQGIRGRQQRVEATSDQTINAIAVMSGIKRGSTSRTFRGGELTAVMGGCEIDLRQAAIEGEAIIDVFAMWGGIEIRVPENWTVIGRVTPLMGGYEDQTRPSQAAPVQSLIIRGMVIMGGIEIKN